jgi:predicted O-methyltransferase YrrM
MMGFDPVRARLGRLQRDLNWMWGLRGLRPRVLWFHWRARRRAWRTNDLFSVSSVTRPADMRVLLKMTRGRNRVVELGTATAWTAITLALDDRRRRVVTYDVIEREEAKHYLDLVGPDVRERIELVVAPGCTGPRDQQPVDLLYIDSSHTREHTIAEVRAWQPYLRPGAPVLFDDYTHPDYPGVREAIEELGLKGELRGTLFIHLHTSIGVRRSIGV